LVKQKEKKKDSGGGRGKGCVHQGIEDLGGDKPDVKKR